MLCIVLDYYFCTLAFILIYSVRGIGIVLDNVCNIIYIYVCIYMDVLFMSCCKLNGIYGCTLSNESIFGSGIAV